MFIEKEIKILDVEYAVLDHQLRVLGAEKTGPMVVTDRYYDDKDNVLQAQHQRLRLRSQGGTAVITKKTKLPDPFVKSMVEQDIAVGSSERGHAILQDIGLQCIKYKEKTRISYTIEDMHFDIDCYDGLPILLEIEGPTTEKILYWIRRLGLHYHVQVKWGSKKLFKHYKNTKKKVL